MLRSSGRLASVSLFSGASVFIPLSHSLRSARTERGLNHKASKRGEEEKGGGGASSPVAAPKPTPTRYSLTAISAKCGDLSSSGPIKLEPFRFFSAIAMTCLSDDSGAPLLSEMIPRRVSIKEQSLEGYLECPPEKVFPVYAMGVCRPESESVVSVSGSGDPIWDAVREEAKLEAEKEPILSSFLYASVLSHENLELALGFVLANRLHNATLLATQLVDIFYDVITNDKAIQRAIRLDVQAFRDRDPACISYSSALLYLKGYHSLQSYRVAHALWKKGRKVLALALQSRVSEVFGVDIHPAARIGEGILLDHGTGLVIGETAVIGDRVSLMQGVTLGGTGKGTGDRHPKIGEGALIGASVTLLGNIKIGEGAMIAAGSLVLNDIPPHGMVAGIPAKVIGYVIEKDPSLTMKHDASRNFFEHVAVKFTGVQDPGRNN
ncbi:serine acetyltransferase 2-like isoform X4 [Syzygium oleosum]|uniref:serine acetyltransferase 2-like isoform X3 n=1 Tax=Syzygium oleosum TaxID=219896 RepID=UPI0024B93F8B|nr:serine acetyltransferase 2-like isoform X3 [Syzygium oleosum]XP_056176685.1 serine acetyltransferase 2-like isoform X4 [Syzygium oleosum]